MPTDNGGETIGERLARLRADLARVRQTIARAETNGQEVSHGLGIRITSIAYEQALQREQSLEESIRALEGRLAGASGNRTAVAQTRQPNC